MVTRMACARAMSIVGHPAVVMPVAVTWASVQHGGGPSARVAVAATLLVAVAVALFSAVQVRAGRWRHVDASVPVERRQLNLFLALLMLGLAATLWAAGQPPTASLGLATGALVVVLAQCLRHWMKVSLHAAFAAYATTLFWPAMWPFAAAVGLTAGVAWSRLVLGRHTLIEVLVGLLAGGSAAIAFRCWV